MSKKRQSIAERVREFIEPYAKELGYEIWDVDFVKEGASWFLKVEIDKEGGVFIEDCEKFSNAISDPLDRLDPIPQSYILEVSSPGLGRRLTRPEHFERMLGERVVVTFIRPQNGKKQLCGYLRNYGNGMIIINTADGKDHIINKKDTANVRLFEEILGDIWNE